MALLRTLAAAVAIPMLAGCQRNASSPADAADVRTVERTRLRALVAGDTIIAAPLHAEDFQLINPLGGAVTKEEYLRGVASGQVDYLFWQPDSITVRRYGAAAVIRYQAELEIIVAGEHVPRARYWHTDLYERRGGRWQVVWSHATQILQSPGREPAT